MVLDKPTTSELASMRSDYKEIRLTCLANIMYLTFKFGDLDWDEAPYTPHLSTQAHLPQTLDIAARFVDIVLVDSSDGKVKYCTKLFFGDVFSAALKTGIMILLAQGFDKDVYDALLANIQSSYSTKQIAENAIVIALLYKPDKKEYIIT